MPHSAGPLATQPSMAALHHEEIVRPQLPHSSAAQHLCRRQLPRALEQPQDVPASGRGTAAEASGSMFADNGFMMRPPKGPGGGLGAHVLGVSWPLFLLMLLMLLKQVWERGLSPGVRSPSGSDKLIRPAQASRPTGSHALPEKLMYANDVHAQAAQAAHARVCARRQMQLHGSWLYSRQAVQEASEGTNTCCSSSPAAS